jgi:lipid-A-disaccharide synthase
MAEAGMSSLFPLDDITVLGFADVIQRLPTIMRRIGQTARAVIKAKPDVLVIIDSPDFTHRVARRVRAAAPSIPIIDYVSPSVWAWRPGRARAMRGYVDHVLALLPFEPAAHARLGGPACTYVGHPVIERIGDLRPDEAGRRRRGAEPPLLLVLPGSRRSEIRRMLDPFAAAIEILCRRMQLELVLPTLPHLEASVRGMTDGWPTRPRVVVAPSERELAFRGARAALAASGTVTLELALAAIPTVAAYRTAGWEAVIARRLIQVPSVILANLVLGENVVPEFLQENCTPERLAGALQPLLCDGPERERQLAAFARLDAIMELGKASPSERAAEVVLAVINRYMPVR